MTRLYDDPHTFTEDMLEGFLDVHRGAVAGVIRATETRPGKVAVVVERLWRAPADTPADSKGSVRSLGAASARRAVPSRVATVGSTGASSKASRVCGHTVVAALDGKLGRVDAVGGDGDHGRGMVRGANAAVGAARAAADAGARARAQSVLVAAGQEWAAKAGGTSGVLWGATLSSIGQRLGDDGETPSAGDVADAIKEGHQAMQRLGKAELGDKTMVDAFTPFVEALAAGVHSGEQLAQVWRDATTACQKAAMATANLRPRIGMARPLAERSVGTPDAGATSLALCASAVAAVLDSRWANDPKGRERTAL
jgi:dihydroxyacetone kinase